MLKNSILTLLFSIALPFIAHSQEISYEAKMIEALKPVDVDGYSKLRIGRKLDGGYIVVDGFNYDCLYSYGISDDIGFEDDFLSHYNIPAYLYDHTIDDIPNTKNAAKMLWKKEGAAAYRTNELNTLRNQLASHKDLSKRNIFLKMDIEGAEWDILDKIDLQTLRNFKQIVIEYHGIGDNSWSATKETKLRVLKKMSSLFHVVHLHGNNHGQVTPEYSFPHVVEITYVRKARDIHVKESTSPIPTPELDYPNHPGREDLSFDYSSFDTKARLISSNYLLKHENKKFSQNGEDGVTSELLNLLYPKGFKGYYVEFGVEDGSECNTRILREDYAWNGLIMDGAHPSNASINLHNEFITMENILSIFKKHSVPKHIELLSIDVDYNDFYFMKEILNNHTIDIIICEYNASHGPDQDKVVVYDSKGAWDGSDYYGSSLLAWNQLLSPKGYSLIYTENMGVNAFFVSNKCLEKNQIRFESQGNVSKIFRPPGYGQNGHPHDQQERPFVTSAEAIEIIPNTSTM